MPDTAVKLGKRMSLDDNIDLQLDRKWDAFNRKDWGEYNRAHEAHQNMLAKQRLKSVSDYYLPDWIREALQGDKTRPDGILALNASQKLTSLQCVCAVLLREHKEGLTIGFSGDAAQVYVDGKQIGGLDGLVIARERGALAFELAMNAVPQSVVLPVRHIIIDGLSVSAAARWHRKRKATALAEWPGYVSDALDAAGQYLGAC